MKPLPHQLSLLSFILVATLVSVHAGPRSSANYSIITDAADAGGKRTTSANYTNDGSAGRVAGLSSVAAPAETAKHGYVGQLYDIVALSVTAPPSTSLNETASRQLAAAPLADDGTTLAALDPVTVGWSIVSGPITSISPGGLATAGNVYQNTAATVGGSAQSLTGQFGLTVLNVSLDDFANYGGDGIDDAWQVQYFGQPPNANAGPNADVSGTGQTNLFKYIAGLNPIDGSRFTLAIAPVPGQTGQKNLSFNPVFAGRTYTVTAKGDLSTGSYSPINGSLPSDNGTTRTVFDLSASGTAKFYRVEITKP